MRTFVLALLTLAMLNASVHAEVVEKYITIKGHKFEPATVEIPANQKIKLVIKNEDDMAEEFESHALNREKIILSHTSNHVFIGPLEPGTYPFFGEFHPDTAQGSIVVK